MTKAVTLTSKELRGSMKPITRAVNSRRPFVTFLTVDGHTKGVVVSVDQATPILRANPEWQQQEMGLTEFRKKLTTVLAETDPPVSAGKQPMATYLTGYGRTLCVLLPPVEPFSADRRPPRAKPMRGRAQPRTKAAA